MFDIALGIFLFLSPIFFLPKQIGNINALQFYQFGILGFDGYNYLQLQFFQYGIIVLFIVALLSKQQRQFNNIGMVSLLVLFCFSVFWHPISVKLFWNVFCGIFLYYIVVTYTKNYKKLLWVIVVVALLNTLFAILQYYGIHLIYGSTGRSDGLMCLNTHLGVYQAMTLPICSIISPYLMIIPLVGIWLSKSILAIFVSLCWMGVYFRKTIMKYGILSVLCYFSILIIFIVKNYSLILAKFNIRMLVWVPTIKMISEKIMLGNGVKLFTYSSSIGLFENPCSIYLQLIYYVGILGIIPIVLLFRHLFGKSNVILLSSIVIALIAGIEKSFLDYPRLAGTFIILFAFLTISKGEKNGNRIS